ncbi:hypothetical protein PIB30_058219 [Stylosanthes scabra]|uniref:Uncharacterized protein n=1 Tax=Stylosanthes scabra TaxID=79078 RepID=A0ABU6SJX0_9FABA|nr:hypothetical protein [Stylosanthes scabra]
MLPVIQGPDRATQRKRHKYPILKQYSSNTNTLWQQQSRQINQSNQQQEHTRIFSVENLLKGLLSELHFSLHRAPIKISTVQNEEPDEANMLSKFQADSTVNE